MEKNLTTVRSKLLFQKIKALKATSWYIIIFCFSLLLFLPFIGTVHLFDWDEINFAECAREMIVSGNYLNVTIDFVPFHEKPPLFIWMQAFSMRLFGVNEFAARFPNSICGVVTLLLIFHIGTKIKSMRFGLMWSLVYVCSILPNFYFKTGIIDPWFNLFIFLSFYFFIKYYESNLEKQMKWACLSAFVIALGVLTKGPVALLIFLISVLIFYATNKFKKSISIKHLFIFLFVFIGTAGSWYVYNFYQNDKNFFAFIKYQIRLLTTEDSGHGGPIYYHILVLLLGCFPASAFLIGGFKKSDNDGTYFMKFRILMIIALFVVLVIFSLVKTKIIHYSSFCYFPISFLAAYRIDNILKGAQNSKFNIIEIWLIGVLGFIYGLIISILPFLAIRKERILNSGILHDDFAAENLKANVYWSGWESLLGIIYFLVIMFTIFSLVKYYKYIYIILFVSTVVIFSIVEAIFVPKIEVYTQGSAIEFFNSFKGKDYYVETIGYKSYAHLFYTAKLNQDQISMDTLLNGKINKKVFFSSKITSADEISKDYPLLRELYKKNGFVFYTRK